MMCRRTPVTWEIRAVLRICTLQCPVSENTRQRSISMQGQVPESSSFLLLPSGLAWEGCSAASSPVLLLCASFRHLGPSRVLSEKKRANSIFIVFQMNLYLPLMTLHKSAVLEWEWSQERMDTATLHGRGQFV